MQQTETYKLNLIETSDPFSPSALNENMEKVEAALSAEAAALDSRVTALEAHHVYVGTYTGNGDATTGQTIHLGFTPTAVLLGRDGNNLYLLTGENPLYNAMGQLIYYLRIVEGGFHVVYNNSYGGWNTQGQKYIFLALV